MMATGLLIAACGLIAGTHPHLFGVAPILGAILCASCFLKPRELFLVGLGGILLRDALTGFSLFTIVRLAGMGLAVSAVVSLKVRPQIQSIFQGLLVASAVFHLSLTVGDWLTGTCVVSSKTAQGLTGAIVANVPYFQRSLVGDLLFTLLFVGAYALAGTAVLGFSRQSIGSK